MVICPSCGIKVLKGSRGRSNLCPECQHSRHDSGGGGEPLPPSDPRQKRWHHIAVLDELSEAEVLQLDLLSSPADKFGGSSELGVAAEARISTVEIDPPPNDNWDGPVVAGRARQPKNGHLVTAWYGEYVRPESSWP